MYSQGQRWNSTDFEIYTTPKKHIQELKQTVKFLLYNSCFYIQRQIFKYIINLVSPASEDAENAI